MSTSLPAKFQDCELLIHYRSEDADEIGQARDVVESWAQRNKISLNVSQCTAPVPVFCGLRFISSF